MKSKRHIWPVRRQAFTLVELLMVIAIIALIAALLMPALKSAREHGRRARCLSNMHQIGIAMLMFADEHGGQLPPYFYSAQSSTNNGNGTTTYTITIKPGWTTWDIGMIANSKILICPTDTQPALINTTDPKGNSIVVPSSYGYNFEFFMEGLGLQAVDTSRTVLIFDGEPDKVSGDWAGSGGAVVASLDGGSGSGSGGGIALAGANGGGSSGGGNPTPTCPSCGSGGKQVICHIVQGNGNNKLYSTICTGDPSLSTHVNNHGDPCGSCDTLMFNDQLLDRRHFNKANIVFADAHAEWLTTLPRL